MNDGEVTHRPRFYRRPEILIPFCFTVLLLCWAWWVGTAPMPPITDAFLFFLERQ